ncbi:hypothetical protein AGMMS50212_17280 [Spirochaetia bacterium]|nr:hypothetical protein AGMMS50212_17280 [Spirochaetia bacterium]
MARARVNLIRVTHKKVKVEDKYCGEVIGHHIEYGSDKEPDSFRLTFARKMRAVIWINENIGTFEQEPESDEEKEAREVKLKKLGIPELVESFEAEAQALFDLFKSIGKTPYSVIKAFNIDRKSILEIIREDIKSLKKRYCQIAFDKLSPINTRLTHGSTCLQPSLFYV